MTPRSFPKDPGATLDYAMNWRDPKTPWLDEGETITEVDVTVAEGITEDSHTEADGLVTVWLSGGTVGQSYLVTIHITTSEGRQDERSFYVSVRDR